MILNKPNSTCLGLDIANAKIDPGLRIPAKKFFRKKGDALDDCAPAIILDLAAGFSRA